MLVLGRGESGKALVIESGQRFAIELDSNPGTGYQWRWVNKPNPAHIKLEEEVHRPRLGNRLLIGGSGLDVWTFRALQNGYTALELEYRRPWENKAPLSRFTLDVTIINNSCTKNA